MRNCTIAANSRYTVFVNADAGTGRELSTYVHSTDQPILVERPMYFDYQGPACHAWNGGHDVVGFLPQRPRDANKRARLVRARCLKASRVTCGAAP